MGSLPGFNQKSLFVLMSNPQHSQFAIQLLAWFDRNGRHDLPWQQDINPYRVWVSEIMLQQTQVKTVIPYYQRFMQSFPDIKSLAEASQERVLSHWAGLGYYARGRNLHKAAQLIMTDYHGNFPKDFDAIIGLPGIGRSTAGAILSISLNQRFAILDGNVKRVLSRFFAIEGWPGQKPIENKMWLLADELTPKQGFDNYTQAIMDLGATLCTRSKPKCENCPVQSSCLAFRQENVDKYPYKKPKKDKPTKQAWLLIRQNENGSICFHRRPQKGIWGGLWSLPEFESYQACEQYLQSQGSCLQSLIEWDSFRHTFSHYHLDIHPLFLDESIVSGIEEKEAHHYDGLNAEVSQEWYSIQSLLNGEVGVPAPVLKLMNRLD